MSSYYDDYYDSLPIGVRYDIYQDCQDETVDTTWKRIKGFDNYFVSIYGDVMSIINGHPHILKTWPNQYGHRYVGLSNGEMAKRASVHRLVAEAFVPNPNGYSVVRHLDDDPENNCAWNLAWGTQADNRRDCVEHGRDFVKGVYWYEKDTTFRSCADAALYFGVSRSLITMCCQGKVHSINGQHLCYANDISSKLIEPEKWFGKIGNYKKVKAINLSSGEELIFNSRKEASEILGIHDSTISNIIAGRFAESKGWTFVDMDGVYD